MTNADLADRKPKEVVYRGASISEQYAADRRAHELTAGERYKFDYHWLEFIGKIGNRYKFRSIAQDIFLADNRETVARYPQLKIQ